MDGVLDLHAFRPRDVHDLVPTWLDACHEHGLATVRIVHGKGRGVQRRIVHAILDRHPAVRAYRLAPRECGGWGATLVTLCDDSQHPGTSCVPNMGGAVAMEFARAGSDCTLEATQRIAAPCGVLFDFLADPRNLATLTPPARRLVLLAPTPASLGAGALLDYRTHVLGLAITWRMRVVVWDPPHASALEQVRGPYVSFQHAQRLEADGDATRLIDRVTYRVPGGVLVDAWLARPHLRRTFAYRHAQLALRFPAR